MLFDFLTIACLSFSPVQSPLGLSSTSGRSVSLSALPLGNGALGKTSVFAQAHQALVNGLLRRVTNTQAAVLRRKAARKLFGGQSAPFFALVGVSLASGSGKKISSDSFVILVSKEFSSSTRPAD